MGLGIMAAISEVVDFDTARLVAEELGAKVEHEVHVTIEERPVSYTHLDVYKRQACLPRRSSAMCWAGWWRLSRSFPG